MKSLKLGMVLGAALLASVSVANAQQQTVKVGYAPFGNPLTGLPGSTTDNYRTLDPKGVIAQGAGLHVAMWVLLLGPVALLAGLPRR